MTTKYQKAAQNLEKVLLEDSNLSAPELRKKLADEGVNVDQFLKRFDAAFRKGVQSKAKREASEAKSRAAAVRGSRFGHLVDKTRQELLLLIQAAKAGQFGAELLARCRNKDASAMTDDELRSWLEDIEKLKADE